MCSVRIITGMELKLRPLVDDDISLVRLWLEKPHVRTWFGCPEDWLYELKNRHDEFSFICHFIVMAKDATGVGSPIGFCQYYDCAESGEAWKGIPLDRVYSIDYLLGEEALLGHGYGRMLVEHITEAVWNDTPAIRIVVEPHVDNTSSRASLLANGYSHDAKLDLFFKERPAESRLSSGGMA